MSNGEKETSLIDRIEGADLLLDIRDIAFKDSFGEDKLGPILEFEEEILKAELDVYNHKAKLMAPIFKKRGEFLKTIPGLWLRAMTNFSQLANFIDPVDRDALEHLEDLTIEHDPKDARNVTFHFHWSKANPYFSDRTLTKVFTIAKEPSNKANGESSGSAFSKLAEKYNVDGDLSSEAVPINWTSKDHDLVAKKPMLDITEIEEYDDFDGSTGSFFNFFGITDDKFMLHAILLELHAKVLDFYVGIDEGDDDDVDSDEEEDDEDPNKVVDLGDDSADEAGLPKKKKAKTGESTK
ncbi:uncharacterized protein MELLADRAFT_77361 [Melampsora larici-populina 98AG31]|uniref:Nucleosome assembly protein n=1 Tax=Melampsora larici-populina (strain 98AG31 / pathotype 3-4-7) TaxID=747676 RepID=F4RGN5_MELLP|nr:uncharacterized protein MELLADRAFT_77361 [Melampsora larici-populina 98AG31]EGG08594.1 hypothetical protein MELLADRAFT_77361 [Melampsora larici-populina 98AG31]